MIPQFPQFRALERTDRADIEKINTRYEPYSDFNFESMWAWDIKDTVKISLLNGNLVIMFTECATDKVVCSFLGNNKLNESLSELFKFLDASPEMQNPKISLVPEVSLDGIDFNKYFIEIDLNTCDYIYDLEQLAHYSGNQFMQKRGRSNTFVRNYPTAAIKLLDIKDPSTTEAIMSLNDSWVHNKVEHHTDKDIDKEAIAMQRFLKAEFRNVFCVGVYDNEKLVGYAIFSFHGTDYVIDHFIKAEVAYKGVYEFLMKESAVLLSGMGYKYLNFEEDMGIPGLRKAKMTYRPVKFLKKYFIDRL